MSTLPDSAEGDLAEKRLSVEEERHQRDVQDAAHARREEAEGREPRSADGRYVSAWERWLR